MVLTRVVVRSVSVKEAASDSRQRHLNLLLLRRDATLKFSIQKTISLTCKSVIQIKTTMSLSKFGNQLIAEDADLSELQQKQMVRRLQAKYECDEFSIIGAVQLYGKGAANYLAGIFPVKACKKDIFYSSQR